MTKPRLKKAAAPAAAAAAAPAVIQEAKAELLCSPLGEENFKRNGTCLSPVAAAQIARMWNAKHPEAAVPLPPALPARPADDCKKLVRSLRSRAKKVLKTALASRGPTETDIAVADHVGAMATADVAACFRPQQPASWKAKPRQWLSNFDIEAVMAQYHANPDFEYEFLGVFPSDFAVPLPDRGGACYAPEMCAPDLIAKLVQSGKRYGRFIMNSDRHDQPGSHWTSVFAVLDPSLPSYGAYYYDSVGNPWPKHIAAYLKTWKAQANAGFRLAYNKRQHQRANTECGMFSMIFQVLWLERLRFDQLRRTGQATAEEKKIEQLLKRKKVTDAVRTFLQAPEPVTFEMIASIPLKDMGAYAFRNLFYYQRMSGGQRRSPIGA